MENFSSHNQDFKQSMKRYLNLKIPSKNATPFLGPKTFSPSHTFSNLDSPIFYNSKQSSFLKKDDFFTPPEIIQSPRLKESKTMNFHQLPSIPNTPPQHLYFNTANVIKTQQIENQI